MKVGQMNWESLLIVKDMEPLVVDVAIIIVICDFSHFYLI